MTMVAYRCIFVYFIFVLGIESMRATSSIVMD